MCGDGIMKYKFGDKLRTMREKKKITLKEVAERAGVSESLISQIERNKVSPAIDTLLQIVEILGIDLEYLFQDFKKNRNVTLVHQSQRKRIVQGGVTYEQLVQTPQVASEHGIEAYLMTIAAGESSGSPEYGHIGKEMGVIISGTGTFSIGSQTFTLQAGDSISFDSGIPHQLKNTGDNELKAFWVITPPKNLKF